MNCSDKKGSKQFRLISPLKRNKRASDLLHYSGTWKGSDLTDCLIFVQETRSNTQF